MIIILPREGSSYSHFNKELRQVFLAITRVWCRKSFPSLFEMTIKVRINRKREEDNKKKCSKHPFLS
jgi:hypothetical protein